MGARIEHRTTTCVGHHRQRSAKQYQRWCHQNGQRGHFHLADIDFLAEVFRGTANHQPGDKHRQQNEQQHAVQARADAAEDDFTYLHQPHWYHAAEGSEGVMHGVDRTAGCRCGHHRKQTAGENTKATLFAFHVDIAVGTERHQVRVTLSFRPHHHSRSHDEDKRHRPQQRTPLTAVAYRLAKGKAQRGRDQEN
ncbi:Uncharacterised protein [Yokenella regensburgei]|nr:Uncharacterised protein [Yokenella regensburgei]